MEDPGRSGPWLLRQLAEVLPPEAAPGPPAEDEGPPVRKSAAGFVSPEMRHHRTEIRRCLERTSADRHPALAVQWFREQPEGWVELDAPQKLRAEPANALVTTAEYFAAVADRSGMEAAYDDERHKALHFEQATELKDHHIERLEAEFRKLRQRVETGEGHVHAMAAETQQLRSANEALRDELRRLHEDRRAAAANLVSLAKRGLPAAHPARTTSPLLARFVAGVRAGGAFGRQAGYQQVGRPSGTEAKLQQGLGGALPGVALQRQGRRAPGAGGLASTRPGPPRGPRRPAPGP